MLITMKYKNVIQLTGMSNSQEVNAISGKLMGSTFKSLKTSVKVTRNMNALNKEYEDVFVKLIKSLEDKYKDVEDRTELNKEINELLDTDVDINIDLLSIDELDSISSKLTPFDLLILTPLISDIDDVEPEVVE